VSRERPEDSRTRYFAAVVQRRGLDLPTRLTSSAPVGSINPTPADTYRPGIHRKFVLKLRPILLSKISSCNVSRLFG
jgi:hypothetical protein